MPRTAAPRPPARGALGLKALAELARRGEIDTVIAAFPDMQGRLVGKRLTASFFLDSVARKGVHACAYLLTVDMEMQPIPGYALTSWEKGYGDFLLSPDLSTLKRVPWLEGTAIVFCDLLSEEGGPIEVSPRRVLRRQVERARKAGFLAMTASELEFYIFKESYEEARRTAFRGATPIGPYIEDYHLFQGTLEEFLVREVRNRMEEAGVPVECSKGEWGRGQQEINLRYAEALAMADRHALYKHGAKEIAWQKGVSLTFMAKWSNAHAGSSYHLHSSLWSLDGKRALFWDSARKSPSKPFWSYLAGQIALARDFSILYAPTVNSYKRYEAGSFAPTALAWGRDNRTCGFRLVGEGPGFHLENRIPGADANPYLAFAATIAAGLHGIERGLEPPKEFRGDAYKAERSGRVPGSLAEAAELWAGSRAAKEAFGEEVHAHYLHAARVEAESYAKAVTDWDLARYAERI